MVESKQRMISQTVQSLIDLIVQYCRVFTYFTTMIELLLSGNCGDMRELLTKADGMTV